MKTRNRHSALHRVKAYLTHRLSCQWRDLDIDCDGEFLFLKGRLISLSDLEKPSRTAYAHVLLNRRLGRRLRQRGAVRPAIYGQSPRPSYEVAEYHRLNNRTIPALTRLIGLVEQRLSHSFPLQLSSYL